ncbi:MAG: glycoside hydrolase [Planctomycetaceae bacterium]|nr:glycoside hydrolase [Planctomycetaceae bacterium]
MRHQNQVKAILVAVAAAMLLGAAWAWAAGPASKAPDRAAASQPQPAMVAVFTRGEAGVHTYRIPSLATTPKGTLLAFCEARKLSAKDKSPTKLVLKRSGDAGRSWGPMQTLADNGEAALMDPTVVVDRDTSRIWLFYVRYAKGWNQPPADIKVCPVGLFALWSDDDGKSWSKADDLTAKLEQPQWTACCLGPGVGIQLRHGDKAGRLIVPFHHAKGQCSGWHMIFSDDHGKSWQIGPKPVPHNSESQVAELADGSLLLNLRGSDSIRRVSRSRDSGQTWSALENDETLIEPRGCQASLMQYVAKGGDEEECLLFSNPADAKSRVNLTMRASYDGGKTWPLSRTIHSGPSAYSCMTVLDDGQIGILFEAGAKSCYEKIAFARLDLK